ncbi:MAG TPA: alpha/beta hydrolase fold domain-containing protein [Actinospica sp.]|jgi:acetyl esterase/lipase|nr:alpha/beta hydrolase fold domain-containing protein [Actinospica sp.]
MTALRGAAVVPLQPLGRAAAAGQAFALAQVLRWTWRPSVDLLGVRTGQIRLLRAALEATAAFVPSRPDVARRPAVIDPPDGAGPAAPLHAEWSLPGSAIRGGSETGPGAAAVLYLHGGGFVFGSARTHRVLTGALAAESGLPVLAPNYRLAPEHPAPAALEDCAAALRHLEDIGIPAHRVVLAGDSAGAHLAAALAARRSELGLPAPAGVLLLSPWLDLSCVALREGDRRCRDPFVSPGTAERLALLYTGPRAAAARLLPTPEVPAGPTAPYLIQIGGREAMAGDAARFAEELGHAKIDCRLEVWPGQIHVFQALHPWVPAARSALRNAGEFARACAGTRPTAAPLSAIGGGSAVVATEKG